jgi:polyisoprenoid-binding protein YceI
MFSLFLSTFLSSALAAPQDYTFDKKGSDLYVTVYKNEKTLLSAAAHNHAIRAKDWTGTLQWDAENPAGCNIAVSFNVSDLEVDSDYSRNLASSKEPDAKIKKGFEKTISDSDRKEVRKNMLSEGQINGDKHKAISFQSTSCTADSITGDFTLRGVKKSITMPAKIKTAESGAWKLLIKGSFNISSSDYGFKPYSGLGGAVANKPGMRINVYLRGI